MTSTVPPGRGLSPSLPRHFEPLQFGHLEKVTSENFRLVGQTANVARSGLKSVAQVLPWVVLPTRISPEGAMRYGDNRLGTFEPDRVRVSSPFRAKRLFLTNPGLTLG
jgi:hypothetical protein